MFSKQLYICQIINKPKPIIMEENNILIDKLNPYEIKDLKEVTSVKTSSRQKEKIVRKSLNYK